MLSNVQYLLTKLAEEAAEVAQIALKTQHFGLDEQCPGLNLTNRERVWGELNDLLTIIEMLNEECQFGFTPDCGQKLAKRDKVAEYRGYSRQLGLVE